MNVVAVLVTWLRPCEQTIGPRTLGVESNGHSGFRGENVWKMLTSNNGRTTNDRRLSHWFDLIDLFFYVPSTIFQLYRDGSSWIEPVLGQD